MSINSVKGNAGGIDAVDLLRQQELEEPARRGANLGGLQVRQVMPPTESPIQGVGPGPQAGISGPGMSLGAASPVSGGLDPALQLQKDLTKLVNILQELQSTAKGNQNPAAAGGPASIEGARKGEGTGQAGLSEGASGARRLEATNDPIRAKDAGETGKAKSATGPTDQISQIMAKVVELQKQLISQVEQKPRNTEI